MQDTETGEWRDRTDLVSEAASQGRDQSVGHTEGREHEAGVWGWEVEGLHEKWLQGGGVPLPGHTGAAQGEEGEGEAGGAEHLEPRHVPLTLIIRARDVSQAEDAEQGQDEGESTRDSEGKSEPSQVI